MTSSSGTSPSGCGKLVGTGRPICRAERHLNEGERDGGCRGPEGRMFWLSSTEVDAGAKVHSQQCPTRVLPPPQVLEEAGLAWRVGQAPDVHGT